MRVVFWLELNLTESIVWLDLLHYLKTSRIRRDLYPSVVLPCWLRRFKAKASLHLCKKAHVKYISIKILDSYPINFTAPIIFQKKSFNHKHNILLHKRRTGNKER